MHWTQVIPFVGGGGGDVMHPFVGEQTSGPFTGVNQQLGAGAAAGQSQLLVPTFPARRRMKEAERRSGGAAEDAGPAAQVIYELFPFPWHSNLQGMFSHHFPTNCSQLAGFFIYFFFC